MAFRRNRTPGRVYENIAKPTLPQLAGFALGFDVMLCRQKKPSMWGILNPASLALTLPVEAASIPLHLALIFTCLLIIGSTGATEVTLW